MVCSEGQQAAINGNGETQKVEPGANETVKNTDSNVRSSLNEDSAVPHLLFSGSTKWDLIGRNSVPKAILQRGGSDSGESFVSFTCFDFDKFPDLRPRSVYCGPCAAHYVIVDEDGTAYGVGRNDCFQLSSDDAPSQAIPVPLLPDEKDTAVASATCGKSHTVLVMQSGASYAVGLNTNGQLGCGEAPSDGKVTCERQWKRVVLPPDEQVVGAAAGHDFSVWVSSSGSVYTAGSGQYGQLGNGRTGERIESRNRISFDTISTPQRVVFSEDVKITQVAAGANHVLALDDLGKVWSWGFGGYGRLGHKSPKDETRPRRIETFDSPHYKLDYVTCGATCSYAIQLSRRSTYFWGLAKKTGESNMYPKPLFDLQGNEMHCLACGVTSTVAATERNLVSWGPSPTFGELGFGKGSPKSSTRPKIVDSMQGLYCKSIAVGIAFTVLVIDVKTDEEQNLLNQLDRRTIGCNDGVEKRKASGRQQKGKSKKKKTR